jgi:hypothetical protein
MFQTPKIMPHSASVIPAINTSERRAIGGWGGAAAGAYGAGFGAGTSAVGGNGFLGRHFSQYSLCDILNEHCLQTQALHTAHLPAAGVFR